LSGWWLVSYLVLWVLAVVLAAVVLALARQVGTLHLRLGPRGALEVDDEGPAIGEAPEPADVADLAGRRVTVGGPGSGQLILFVSPGCPVCREVLPGVGPAARMGGVSAVVVSDGDRPHTGGNGSAVPVVWEPELVRRYDVPGTPYAIVMDETGVVRAKGTVNNLEQLEGLVETAGRRRREARGAPR
jgi:methylamine dehydrogenase accessory protein MauD